MTEMEKYELEMLEEKRREIDRQIREYKKKQGAYGCVRIREIMKPRYSKETPFGFSLDIRNRDGRWFRACYNWERSKCVDYAKELLNNLTDMLEKEENGNV